MSTWGDLPEYLKSSDDWFSIEQDQLAVAHRRCVEYGVDPALDLVGDVLRGLDLKSFLAKHAEIIVESRRLFSSLIDSVEDKACAFVLTDAQARIIELFAAPEVISFCAEHGARPGSSLSEESCGTNAVSLALHYKKPIILKGKQHFAHLFHDWLCVSVPIMNREGNQIGCADLSMGDNAKLDEKLALIKSVAAQLAPIMDKKETPSPTGKPAHRKLSKRQNQIMGGLVAGRLCKEISLDLGIKATTVETHVSQMKKKYAVRTLYELIAKYGYLHIPSVLIQRALASETASGGVKHKRIHKRTQLNPNTH